MKRSLLLFVTCLMCVGAYAQNDSTQRNVLTFEQAVNIAIQNSILLNQQRNNLELNQMQKVSSIASLLPSVNGNVGIGRNIGNNFIQQIGVVTGTVDGMSASLNGNLNLFSGFSAINNIRANTKFLEAQTYNVARTTQDAINTVATQYLIVMLDVELFRIAKENHDVLKKQLTQIQEMLELGSKSAVDEQNQITLTKGAELRMVQAEIQLNNDKTTLQQQLLIDPFLDFDVEKPNWDTNALGDKPLDIQQMVERAKQSRGDYLRAVKQEEALRYNWYSARGGFLPSIGASAGISSGWNFTHGIDPSDPNYPRPFDSQFKQDNLRKTLGISMQVPLFNGFQQRTIVTQARVNYENQKLTTKNLDYQIKNDVIRAVRNFDRAKTAFTITTEQLAAAELAFQYETERFNLGASSFVDFANANVRLVQAQTDKSGAEYTLVFQRILLEYAVGTLKPEDIAATTK